MTPLKVWSRFTAKNKTGTVFKFRIVQMPEHLMENLIDQFIDFFVKEETTFKSTGVPKSKEALSEVKEFTIKVTKDKDFHIVICCLDNDDDEVHEIIGASMMALTTPEGTEIKDGPKSKDMQKFFEMYVTMSSMYNEMKAFNLDRCFEDRGVFVRPDYRGLGVAQELLKVRRLVCKEFEVTVHGAWMTSYGTQKAAERDGWETVYEFNYKEFGEQLGVTIDNGPEFCKFMIVRIH